MSLMNLQRQQQRKRNRKRRKGFRRVRRNRKVDPKVVTSCFQALKENVYVENTLFTAVCNVEQLMFVGIPQDHLYGWRYRAAD